MNYVRISTCTHCRQSIEQHRNTNGQKSQWRHSRTGKTACPSPPTHAEPKEYT